MSATKPTLKVLVNDLQPEHLSAFNRTRSSILSTTLAERTFAQIIDGLPTRDTIGWFPVYSPEIRDNTTSSAEALEEARKLREKLKTLETLIDVELSQAYQDAPIRSQEFHMRLFEMLAVSCHDIAAYAQTKYQPGFRREGYTAEQLLTALGPRPTDFMHEDYYHHQQYPQKVADIVGYWAEYHLFGGVVLFDRGESGTDCKRAFLHPVGGFRIFQISELQFQQFVQWVQLHDEFSHDIQPPFPLSAERYTYRVDPFEAMSLNIYRDKYERIIPNERPHTCVQRLEDLPEMQDALARINDSESSQ